MTAPDRDWRGLAWVSAVALACVAAAVVDAAWLLRTCAKEGPAEASGLVVLCVAGLGWAAVRAREGAGAALVAAACVVLVGEELDWGGVGNLHNSLAGVSYLLFAVPFAALYAAALWGLTRPRWIPPRLDGVAFGLVAVAAGGSLLVPLAWERALDEVSELLLYTLLAVGGWRSAQPRSSKATKQRAPRAPSPVR